MLKRFIDPCVGSGQEDEKISMAKRLGWSGICFVKEYDSGHKTYAKEIKDLASDIEVYAGALISPRKPEEVQKLARSAVEVADLVLVSGGDEEINRAAAECWEVDILCHPEKVAGRDLMDQKNSGLDEVMVRYMAERCIGLEIDLSQLLDSYGSYRSQTLARMRQNMMLAEKYDAPLIISSGAKNLYGMRSPQDLASVLSSIGCRNPMKALTENPEKIIKKSLDRRDPNVLLAGLSVVSWGEAKPAEKKRMYGWY